MFEDKIKYKRLALKDKHWINLFELLVDNISYRLEGFKTLKIKQIKLKKIQRWINIKRMTLSMPDSVLFYTNIKTNKK